MITHRYLLPEGSHTCFATRIGYGLQAVCSRHALRIGSKVVPLVKFIIVVFYPITKPLSIMLDK